jgi:hypothetical protein
MIVAANVNVKAIKEAGRLHAGCCTGRLPRLQEFA